MQKVNPLPVRYYSYVIYRVDTVAGVAEPGLYDIQTKTQ
jgi:hypothetical protein